MPCMGPYHDTKTPRSITQILREDPNALNWERGSRLHHFERVVAQALGVKWVSMYNPSRFTEKEREAFRQAFPTIRNTSQLMLALLHGTTHETVDWDKFGTALDEVMWAIDCHEF